MGNKKSIRFFNDPQSELINEKIVRAIETYNKQSSRDIQVRPLRIDKYIKGETYTITDEILSAIESSSHVIADISNGNKMYRLCNDISKSKRHCPIRSFAIKREH